MTTSDIVVTGLTVLTLLNLFLLLGIIRRLREITEEFHHADSGLPGMPEPGHVVGEFRESTLRGEPVTDEQLRSGTTLVMFLSPSCEPCKAAATRLANTPRPLPHTVVFLQAAPGEPELDSMLAALEGVDTIALIEPDGPAASALSVKAYPTALLVQDGEVTAASFDLADVLLPEPAQQRGQ